MKKRLWITIMVIIGVVVFAFLIKNGFVNGNTSQQIAECIGENSVLYVQLGCHACENQEKLFGENYQYLNVIDCWYERDKCEDITATPTWIINGEKYVGVQTIEKLKELTGCN